ncbi:hypothetical protein QBC47DRAFT_406456 [Echria macrotheca]|uniref:Azaphilone pigments biosynthesis cluster protein L N-terminal domain-containing protein n=1 Tax=Echria macrotheca TaxID=438768 RepID=A0AAJ0B3X5_9PEZI|nr:hypothetical protein QBC47DRAFT_406456 [Echria macrotheca]
MDPLSISVAVLSITECIRKTSTSITDFIRTVRSARPDLAETSRQLRELDTILKPLRGDDTEGVPENPRSSIKPVLINCESILDEITDVLDKHKTSRLGAVRWASSGKSEVAKLNAQLGAYLRTLGLAIGVTTLTQGQDIKNDTRHIPPLRDDVAEILHGMAELKVEVAELKSTLPPALRGRTYLLDTFLDSLTTYTESIVDAQSVRGNDDDDADDDYDEDFNDQDSDDYDETVIESWALRVAAETGRPETQQPPYR